MSDYKCQSCGGSMEFDSATQKLICPYCGATHDVAAYDAQNQQAQNQGAGFSVQQSEWNMNADGLMSYICKSCGGEVLGDASVAATSCPYCDSPIVRNDQFSGGLKPDMIIPFKLDKKQAKEKLNRFISGKKLVPRVFKDQKHIDEMKGVYVPFWLFDADVDGEAQFSAERRQGDQVGEFDVYRRGTLSFRNVPVDASSKMEDDMMDSIEPFNMNEATAFSPAYLAGYMADKYDVTPEECFLRGNERIKKSVAEELGKTLQGYSAVNATATNMNILQGQAKYALLPVWILNTTWEGKQYRFAMNGQTGKYTGDMPFDKKAYRRTQLFTALGVDAAVFAGFFLFWLFV